MAIGINIKWATNRENTYMYISHYDTLDIIRVFIAEKK